MMKEDLKVKTNQKIKFGIVPKLLLGILIPLFIILGITGVFLGIQGYKTVDNIMGAELEAETEAAAKEVEALFGRYYGIAECLASTPIIRDTTIEQVEGGIANHRLFSSLLETLRLIQEDNKTDVTVIWTANIATGEVLQSDGQIFSLSDMDITSRDWYKDVMQNNKTILTAVYKNINTDDRIVTIASPMFVNNEIKGIIGIDINIKNLTQILSKVSVGETGYITLYDSENIILYHPDNNFIDVSAKEANYSENMLTKIINKEDTNTMLYTRSGVNYYGSLKNIDLIGYTMLGIMPEAEFTLQTNSILNILIVGAIACGIVLTFVCLFIALSITKPLKRLNNTVGMLADGNLDVTVDVKSRDEVSQLAYNVQRIVERLKEYILYIDEISSVLYQIGEGNLGFKLEQEYLGEFAKVKEALLNIKKTLTETLTSVIQSAEQVNVGAGQIADGAQSLAQGATEQASNLQELSATLNDISSQVDENSSLISEVEKTVERTVFEVTTGSTKMEEMLDAMNDINEHSKEIEKIIKSIEDIAFQTNILALNAAVEAARAGVAGKGFAVVADEVRRLAGSTAEASKNTSQLILKSLESVQNGKKIADETADSLRKIADDIVELAIQSNKASENSALQNTALNQITIGFDQVANVVQTNSATAQQSAAASQELSGQATILKQLTEKFKLPKEKVALGETENIKNDYVENSYMENNDTLEIDKY